MVSNEEIKKYLLTMNRHYQHASAVLTITDQR